MHELLSSEEMAVADRLTIAAGLPGRELMENAGRAVADVVAARLGLVSQIVVVAGSGNNAGEGFVAARVLRERGYRVRVLAIAGRESLNGDAAAAAERLSEPLEPATPECLTGASLVIDALFGAG